ncbi:hypothetical protein [Portibacter marinus]|uniref:hypothetical protein n=1 Tax=Portibacter marinus TaxID=2898660 RepID=UPI001F30CDFA|nr:hypothetical protein [Portibacter marinus]
MIKNACLLCFVVIGLAYGCKSDNKSELNYELEGRWSIYEAYRDGDLTTTLEDGFFEFQDSQLVTNILGSPISGVYKLEQNAFNHNSALPATYQIKSYNQDSMELETEIRGFDFLFKLHKALDTIPSDI